MHVPYGDSCHFAIAKAFMVATTFWHQTSSLQFGVGCVLSSWVKRSTYCSTRDSWVETVGAFVEVLRAERRMVQPRWLPLSTSIISVSHHRFPWASTTVSVTAIDKVGLNKMRIVNCMFLPSAKFDVKKWVVSIRWTGLGTGLWDWTVGLDSQKVALILSSDWNDTGNIQLPAYRGCEFLVATQLSFRCEFAHDRAL